MNGNGPLSPDVLAAQQAYWNSPGLTSQAPPPAPEPAGPMVSAPPPPDPAMSYYGAGPPPPPSPAPPPSPPLVPQGPPGKLAASDFGFGGDVPPPPKPASPAAPQAPPPVTTIPEVTVAGHAAPRGGGGPSGPSALDRANAAYRGTFDQDKADLQSGADAEKAKAELMASGMGELARSKMDEQQTAEFEAAHQAETFKKYQDETQRQIDAVRTQTINPNRAYADSGSAVTAVIGGILGGIYQGLNRLQSNPFIDQMNKNIDRDIAAQEHDIAVKKGGIEDRKSLYAEMRATYKDEA